MTSVRLGALASALALLAGCQDYFVRRETLSYQSGDAAAANVAIHVIDPWPEGSSDTRIPGNGKRAARTIANYEAGPKLDLGPTGSAQTTGGAALAPQAAGASSGAGN